MDLKWEQHGITWWQVDGQDDFDSKNIFLKLQTVFWSFFLKISKEKFLTYQTVSNVQK